MLDYYGSIILKEKEIDNFIIQDFKQKANESYIHKIINNLRINETLANEYSVSGWNMFFKKEIYNIILITINHQKSKNEKKLKFLYCYNQSKFYNNDISNLICDKI